jgi:hypothetical protein
MNPNEMNEMQRNLQGLLRFVKGSLAMRARNDHAAPLP